MKIFIVFSNLCFGGAERVAATLANGFHDRGHEVVVVTNLFEEINYPLNPEIKTENFVSTNDNKIKKWSSAVKNLRNLVQQQQPDVVIGIMELCSLLAKICTLGTKIPVIATDHYAFERPQNSPFSKQEWFFKFVVNHIYNHITVLTKADKNIISKRFKEVTVMANPLSLIPITEIPQKERIVLATGRVSGWYVKGFDILLQAWSKIISNEQLEISNYDYSQDGKPSHWWLKIAGDGKQESFEYLMNLLPDGEWVFNDNDKHSNTKNTEEKGINTDKLNSQKSGVWRSEKYHIEFLGFRKDIEELYKKSSIFVLSSRYEGFGLVLIEAMSQGCACVACDYKGRQAEILSPSGDERRKTKDETSGIEITENGILCEPDDVEALASALKKMMKDENYQKQVQRNAVERSKFYDIEHTMNRWEEYLEKII